MKKLAIFLALIISPMLVSAQSLFDKYEDINDVTSVVVTKNMFKLLGQMEIESDDPEVKEYLKMVNSLDNIKVFMTEDESIGASMRADFDKHIEGNAQLEELMRIKEDGKFVKFYFKPGKTENMVSELLMFMDGDLEEKDGTVVMSITGNIDLKQISKLTKELNIPGSKELENVEKNRK